MSKYPVPTKSKSLGKVSPLQLYLQEIAKYPLLEPEEELALAQKHWEDGDAPSAHRLITSNLRLVVKIATDFRRAQVNLLDLIQEGNYGLMQAVKRYNPYKGVKLSSYAAWWIRAYILKYLLDNTRQVKLATTASQRKLFYNLQKETEKLLLEYDSADPKLIAAHLDVSEKDVLEMQKRLHAIDVPLDAPTGDGDGPARSEIFADHEGGMIDAILADKQVKWLFEQYVDEFKSQLKGRDLEIFESRILAENPKTLQEIGDKYKITRERARQIEARIVDKLKQFVKEKGTLDL